VNFFPDHVDPDDVSPDTREPGGRYYNPPEVYARYHATAYWHNPECPRWEEPAQRAAWAALAAREPWDKPLCLEERLYALKNDRAWNRLLGN
jgi:hypothetical protein